MKRRLAALTAAAIFVSPAAALADATIQAVDGTAVDNNNRWAPATPTVKVGELVTWSFAGTANLHNVKSDSSNWTLQTPFAAAGPSAEYRFTTPGTYTFLCELHKATMTGSVTVTDETGAPPPPPPPPPLSAQPFANDTPALTVLEVRDTVAPKLDRVAVTRVRKGARVRFRLSEAGKVTIRLTRRGHAAKSRTFEVRKGTSSATVKGLAAGSYRVRVSATDLAGIAARATKSARVTVRSSH
jgi:plastocyanin